MNQETYFSDEFIKQICTTYSMHEPLIAAAQQKHRELRIFVGMLKAGFEMSDVEGVNQPLAACVRLSTHMDNIMAMLTRLHAAAKQANTVMMEHSECIDTNSPTM